jgi:hypothetical protein
VLIVTTPTTAEGQRKRPRSNLFVNRQAPCPSCQTILIRSLRRPLKINKSPSNGSRFNVSCTRRASHGNPFLMSVWPVASQPSTIAYRDCSARTPFGTGIIDAPKHRARGPAHQRPPRHRREPAFHHRDQFRSGLSSSLQTGPNVAALLPALSAARRLDTARRNGLEPNPEPQARQAPSLSPRAARQRSDLERPHTFAPAADVSGTILVLSSADQWRRGMPFAKISTRIDLLILSAHLRSHAAPIAPNNQGGRHRRHTAFLGSRLLLHHERQHHGRCHTSVSWGARNYRRQPVVIQ